MEFFDVCDENGMPTGEVVEREAAHRDGVLHRTAHVWLVREQAGRPEVLLQKRSENKDSFPGCLDTSSAGHIHAGDEPLISALRELEEELGIHAEESELIPVGSFRISFAKEFHHRIFRDEEVAFVYIYNGNQLEEKNFTLQQEEVESVEWHDLEETKKAISEHDPKYCVPTGGFKLVEGYFNKL